MRFIIIKRKRIFTSRSSGFSLDNASRIMLWGKIKYYYRWKSDQKGFCW